MAVPYGADVAGVRGLLPHRSITPSSRPSEEDVARFLETIGGSVYARAGRALATVTDADELEELTDLARGVVHLGAAAMTEDAAYPERAGPASTGYGALLWQRYRGAFDDLLHALGIVPGEATAGARDEPAASFPDEPLFTRDELHYPTHVARW